jgi:diacylglycerol kinase
MKSKLHVASRIAKDLAIVASLILLVGRAACVAGLLGAASFFCALD